MHWGTEMAQIPSPRQRHWARQIVRAGADVVLGHHPHVLQPMEIIQGVPVVYSLGNFLFSDSYWRGRGAQGDLFLGKFRLHPLSRKTAWAEIVLRKSTPAACRFHFARLRRDLSVCPENTGRRIRHWNALCRRLQARDYDTEYAQEHRMAIVRKRWPHGWRRLIQRLDLLSVRLGLRACDYLEDDLDSGGRRERTL